MNVIYLINAIMFVNLIFAIPKSRRVEICHVDVDHCKTCNWNTTQWCDNNPWVYCVTSKSTAGRTLDMAQNNIAHWYYPKWTTKWWNTEQHERMQISMTTQPITFTKNANGSYTVTGNE